MLGCSYISVVLVFYGLDLHSSASLDLIGGLLVVMVEFGIFEGKVKSW